jgi:hypothetical protein
MPDPFKSHWPPPLPSRPSGRTPTPTATRPAANRDAATDGTSLHSLHHNAAETTATTGAEEKTRRPTAHDGEKNAGCSHRQQDSAVKPTAGHGVAAARSKPPKPPAAPPAPNAATHAPRKAPNTVPTCVESRKPKPHREARRNQKQD